MELILKAKDIRVEFKGRDVLDINELEVYDYDRIGLVGANGAGKSTLLRVLLGELTPPGCKMNRLGELAYIPQLDEVTLQVEKDFALVGKLGVEQLDIQTMSGGEETRLKIAQALSAQVHGILADEPTSHLDREGIDFLIGQLKYFTGALLVISHDRYFLDEIVDKIWELKDGKITEYWGNYSDYLRQKEEERKSQAAEYEQFIAERARLERAAEEKRKQARKIEQKAKGSSKKKSTEDGGRLAHQKSIGSKEKKMHNAAKSLEHRIAALGNVEAPEDIRRIRFRQSKALELHNPYPIVGTEINKIFGDKALFENASFQIPLGAKVALTGGNGTGKTTILKILNQVLKADSGSFRLGSNVKIGYYDQEHHVLHMEKTIFQEISDDYPNLNNTQIRKVLAAFLFTGDDVFKLIGDLSGGERGRVSLAKLMLSEANFLILDEPTNHLDITSKEILEHALNNYTGTVLYVSHDRYFINQTATRIMDLVNHTFVNYIGNYDYYLEKKEELTAAYSNTSRLENNSSSATTDLASDSKLSWQEQKEAQAKERKRANEFKKTEERIGVLEDRSAEIDILMAQEEVYTNSVKCQELAKERAEIDAELETLYEKWEELAE